MTKALIKQQERRRLEGLDKFAFEATTRDELRDEARLFRASGTLGNNLNVEGVYMVLVQGRELGLSAMQSLRNIHIINGKPTISANMLKALCLQSDACEYFTEASSTSEAVTVKTKRRGEPSPTSITWTLGDAAAAGLDGANWKKFPRAMLRARATAELARAVYPDVCAGIYLRAEVEPGAVDEIDADLVIDVAPVADKPPAQVNRRGSDSKKVVASLAEKIKLKLDARRESPPEGYCTPEETAALLEDALGPETSAASADESPREIAAETGFEKAVDAIKAQRLRLVSAGLETEQADWVLRGVTLKENHSRSTLEKKFRQARTAVDAALKELSAQSERMEELGARNGEART